MNDARGPLRGVRSFIFLPMSLAFLLLFVIFLLLLPLLVLTVGDLLGLTPLQTAGVFLAIVLGSLVNLPIAEVESHRPVLPPFNLPLFPRGGPTVLEERVTVIAVNVGGAIIPAILSLWFLLALPPAGQLATLGGILVVTLAAYHFARPVPGLGIALPPLLPPLAAVAATTALFDLLSVPMGHIAPAAFSAGVLGTLVGADVLNLRRLPHLGASIVSIGGAGTFDGIFLAGVGSTLFAALFI